MLFSFDYSSYLGKKWHFGILDARSLTSILIGLLFLGSLAASAYYYMIVKTDFFDDAFIYLNCAKNGAEIGSWRYFPLVNRNALLASSPLKLIFLTISSYISSILGHSVRNLESARFILLLNGIITWLSFSPFWWTQKRNYTVLGIVYFLLSTCLISIFDFEGGLILLWIGSLVMVLADATVKPKSLAVLLAIGPLIRLDCAIIVYAVLFSIFLSDTRIRHRILKTNIIVFMGCWVLWVVTACIFKVYPIPITYWAKSTLPLQFDTYYFAQRLFDWIGGYFVPYNTALPITPQTLGTIVIGSFTIVAITRLRNGLLPGLAGLITCSIIFFRLPANYNWYYDNIIVLMIGVLFSIVLFSKGASAADRWPSLLVLISIFAALFPARGFRSIETPWSFNGPSRAEAYQYLAAHATGRGTYDLPQTGEVLIKSNEIGIIAYFEGKGAWIWDGAGLAQPVDVPAVTESVLRLAYPQALQKTGADDARILATRLGRDIPVKEVWGVAASRFDDARKKCGVFIEQAALCINDFRIATVSEK